MANTQALIAQAYSAFNRRDAEGVFAVMSENIDWPKASEGGRVVRKFRGDGEALPVNGSRIARADVADFMMEQLTSSRWLGRGVYVSY